MRVILNVLWLVLSGLWMAIAWVLAALLMFLLIVTIPFGIQAIKIAAFALWPFGRTLVKRPDAGAPSALGNVIRLILAGWWLALGHLVAAVALAITIKAPWRRSRRPLALGTQQRPRSRRAAGVAVPRLARRV